MQTSGEREIARPRRVWLVAVKFACAVMTVGDLLTRRNLLLCRQHSKFAFDKFFSAQILLAGVHNYFYSLSKYNLLFTEVFLLSNLARLASYREHGSVTFGRPWYISLGPAQTKDLHPSSLRWGGHIARLSNNFRGQQMQTHGHA